jgi:hypothetical protein
MPRVLRTATGVHQLQGDLFTPEERSTLADRTLPPELLHRCRFGRAEYDWRATAVVGRFICRGCGIAGQCGACAELAGQRVPPGVVPSLCALHGGLLEIGIAAVALAVNVPQDVIPRRKLPPPMQAQLTLLTVTQTEQRGKEDEERDEMNNEALVR